MAKGVCDVWFYVFAILYRVLKILLFRKFGRFAILAQNYAILGFVSLVVCRQINEKICRE
jgi:hypothetical protein